MQDVDAVHSGFNALHDTLESESAPLTGDNDHHYHTDELPDNSVVESTNDSDVECVVGTPHSDNIVECVVTPVECVNIVTECDNQIAAVQARATVAKEQKPIRPLNVTSIKGTDIGTDQLIEQKKAEKSLNKYRRMHPACRAGCIYPYWGPGIMCTMHKALLTFNKLVVAVVSQLEISLCGRLQQTASR